MGKIFDRMTKVYLLAWGISYVACLLLKPDIAGATGGRELLLFMGALILLGLAAEMFEQHDLAEALYGLSGVLEVFGMVASWTGVVVWNVKSFENQALYQLNMAMLDFAAAILLFYRVLAVEEAINGALES